MKYKFKYNKKTITVTDSGSTDDWFEIVKQIYDQIIYNDKFSENDIFHIKQFKLFTIWKMLKPLK